MEEEREKKTRGADQLDGIGEQVPGQVDVGQVHEHLRNDLASFAHLLEDVARLFQEALVRQEHAQSVRGVHVVGVEFQGALEKVGGVPPELGRVLGLWVGEF